MTKVLVAGAGGAIGGHLVRSLWEEGHEVVAADIKPLEEWWQRHDVRNLDECDLSVPKYCELATTGVDDVYMLAADMGGMGFIENNKAACMLSVLISTNMLLAAKEEGARYFYSSSACVYPSFKQDKTFSGQTRRALLALHEDDAYPADPEDGYGWEKLFSERMCRHFDEDYGMYARVARYHNVYGPHGSWTGGREKAPAAICRKVIEAGKKGTIEIWGDGEQTRSFMYVDDCIFGTRRIMESNHTDPINLGSAEVVTINELVDTVEEIAGYKVKRQHNLDKPQGVRGRNSDNSIIQDVFGWEPSTPLLDGLEVTFRWIYDQMK